MLRISPKLLIEDPKKLIAYQRSNQGSYGKVYNMKNPKYVLKTCDELQDAWPLFIMCAMMWQLEKPGTRIFPKVKQLVFERGKESIKCRAIVEKLHHVRYAAGYWNLHGNYSGDDEGYGDKAVFLSKHIIKSVIELEEYALNWAGPGHIVRDLHTKNWMMRKSTGQHVVIDPWAYHSKKKPFLDSFIDYTDFMNDHVTVINV